MSQISNFTLSEVVKYCLPDNIDEAVKGVLEEAESDLTEAIEEVESVKTKLGNEIELLEEENSNLRDLVERIQDFTREPGRRKARLVEDITVTIEKCGVDF